MSLEQEIKDRALQLGLDGVGISDASPLGAEHVRHFEAWLRSGYAGRMDYMHRHLEKRTNPANLLQDARSVIIVALNYKPSEECPEAAAPAGPAGRVAQYAHYEDYHRFLGTRLHDLADFLSCESEPGHRFKVCVDSAPLAEKALAMRAGLGFIGRNHLLIHPRLGPQVLLGEIVTTLALGPDEPHIGTCGDCRRCLNACPTGALREDGFLDARRCISYLTQYEPGEESVRDIGDWLFGCDECLLACPYRQRAAERSNECFRYYPERATVNLEELLSLSAKALDARFRESPMVGGGLRLLKRNARVCLENLQPEGEERRA